MTYSVVRKSGLITNLDASPIVRPGYGTAAARISQFMGTITMTTGDDNTKVYRMVRIPTSCIVRRVAICMDAAVTTFAASVGLLFSDCPTDGTSAANVAPASGTAQTGFIASTAFFAYQLDMHTFAPVPGTDPSNTVGLGGGFIDITFMNSAGNSVTDGYYVPSNMNLPVWNAVTATPVAPTTGALTVSGTAITSDPGGFFDISLFHTSTTSGTAKITLLADVILS